MPEPYGESVLALYRALTPYQRRLRWSSFWAAVTSGAAAGGFVSGVLLVTEAPTTVIRIVTAAVTIAGSVSAAGTWCRRWPYSRVAHAIEQAGGRFDNLVITAESVASGRTPPPHSAIWHALVGHAITRLERHSAVRLVPLMRDGMTAGGIVLALVLLLAALPARAPLRAADGQPGDSTRPIAAGDLEVLVTPPAYTRRAEERRINPLHMSVLEGSRVRLRTPRASGRVWLMEPFGSLRSFESNADEWQHEFVAATTRALLVRFADTTPPIDHMIQVTVDPDEPPQVILRRPARDLVFPAPTSRVPIEIEARDDVALESLDLRYTRMSGSGEGFTFAEGRLPLRVTRDAADRVWTARATIPLADLGLQEGDTLVYRATATDRKPGMTAKSSESYLIEIGPLSGTASTGFALPEDRERQAISQQMLIIKTERLLAERPGLMQDAVVERARLLAVEQRMVRAEFVFMTGGEVQDEEEEAAQAHDLAEGRQENQGQAELMAAIREMSRAESQLTAANVAQALVFERAALRALQRAFDRRRYLLRALPERARIDATRRLSGDRTTARSTAALPSSIVEDEIVARGRRAMRALADRSEAPGTDTTLAALVMAVDPRSERLQAVALRLVAAKSSVERNAARLVAERQLAALVAGRLKPTPPSRISANPFQGRVAEWWPGTKGRQ